MNNNRWRILFIAALACLVAIFVFGGPSAGAQDVPIAGAAQLDKKVTPLPVAPDGWFLPEGESLTPLPSEPEPLPPLSAVAVLSDGQFVYGPNVGDFDVRDYIAVNAPHLNGVADVLYGRAHRLSINPRVLLALMEARTELVTNPRADLENPFGLAERGFATQLDIVGAGLNDAFYTRLYGGVTATVDSLALPQDATDVASLLNAGTTALYVAMADLGLEGEAFSRSVDKISADGFYVAYTRLFPGDDPLDQSNRLGNYPDGPTGPLDIPPTPPGLLQLPYARGQSWTFNSVHGAAGGSDMSSMDFARSGVPWPTWPTFDTSSWTVTAAASGTGTRISNCNYKIAHDVSGWTTAYYHLKNVIGSGRVNSNDPIGVPEPSEDLATCDDGTWDAIHVHFTLIYNGAYVPLNGRRLSGWSIHSGSYPYDTDPSQMYLYRAGNANRTRGDYVHNDYDGDDGRSLSGSQTVGGTISPASDADIYSFEGTQGQSATLDMTKNGGDLDTYLYLIRPDGMMWYNDDWNGTRDSHIYVDSLPQTGTYVVMARSYSQSSSGAYNLSLATGGGSVTCADDRFKVEYFRGREPGVGSPVYTTCVNYPLDNNWGDGGPGNGVPNDEFSARWTGRFNFSGGNTRFVIVGDDGVRLWVDGQGVLTNGWKLQAPTEYKPEANLSAGWHDVKFEFFEAGGGATARLRWEAAGTDYTPPAGYTFCAWEDQRCNFTDRTDVAYGANGRFHYRSGLTGGIDCNNAAFGDPISGVFKACFKRSSSNSGNLALNRSAAATSQESSSYSPSKGNDGNGGTRWSSAISSSLGEQFWRVDLGSQQNFNKVRVNWEAAYAAEYKIVWSDDGDNWYCFCDQIQTTSGPGWKEYTFSTRYRRYVGIHMIRRAPTMNNYSFWEMEVYHDGSRSDDLAIPDQFGFTTD